VCQGQATLFDLGALGPATALNAGRWVGDGLLPHACGRASPAPSAGAARGGTGPLPGGWGSGPPRPVGAVRPVMVWPSHVAAPDLRGESGSAGATRELPCLPWHAEVLDLRELREGPKTAIPAVSPEPYATPPRGREGDHG
jgi:hypothetical protein